MGKINSDDISVVKNDIILLKKEIHNLKEQIRELSLKKNKLSINKHFKTLKMVALELQNDEVTSEQIMEGIEIKFHIIKGNGIVRDRKEYEIKLRKCVYEKLFKNEPEYSISFDYKDVIIKSQ